MRTRLGCLFLFAAWIAAAQQNTGSIFGTVVDPSGAAVPGAKITLVSQLTGLTRVTVSAPDGLYTVVQLPVGVYRVRVEQSGFEVFSQNGVTIDVNQKVRLDMKLTVGSVDQTVEVSANAVQVDTSSMTLGKVVDDKKIIELPLNGRNFTQLGTLMPGVVPPAARVASQFGADLAFSVGGMRTQSNNFLLDGVSNYDSLNSSYVIAPPPDALSEFKINTHNSSAEYGRTAGAEVNVVTRAGTNQFHGSAWDFFRNSNMDAFNYFSKIPGGSKPVLKWNQFGATGGGAIRKDKTFFFGYYEGLRKSQGTTFNAIVPTALERTGDFSQSSIKPKDPTTGLPYPNNVVPLNAVAQNVLAKFVPLANNGTRYTVFPIAQTRTDQGGARIDHRLTDTNNLFARYSVFNQDITTPSTGTTFLPAPTRSTGTFQNATVSDTYVISPTMTNIATVAFGRQYTNPTSWSGISQSSLGFQYTNTLTQTTGVPNLSLGNFTVGDPTQNFVYLARNTYEAQDTFAWVKDKHNIKAGADYRRDQVFETFPNRPNGDFTFNGSYTGNPLADFYVGQAFQFRQGGGDATKDLFGTGVGLFVQDDIRLKPRFTLNIGVRYELQLPFYDKQDRLAAFQFGTQSKAIPAAPPDLLFPGDLPRATIATDKKDFAPRIGFAWDPFGNGKTSIRAAYGIYYDQLPALATFENINNPPFLRFIQINNVPLLNPYASFPVDPRTQPFPCSIVSTATNAPVGCLILGFSPDFHTGYAQHYNLTVQRQVTPNMLAEIGYVGSTGTKLPGYLEINGAPPSPAGTPAGSNLAGYIQLRRPSVLYNLVRPTYSEFNSSYHSLQASLNKRFSHGHSFLISYTFSRAIDFQDSVNLGETFPQNGISLKDVRGLAQFDVRQRFVTSYNWELPFLQSSKGIVREVLAGWQLGGILTFQTGNPLTATDGRDLNFQGLNLYDRPDEVADPNSGPHSQQQWFNTSAFALTAPLGAVSKSVGRFGTAGRDTIIGPGTANWDFAVLKDFRIHENHSLQFRMEMFNFLNHTNFNAPGTSINLGAASFGVITSAKDPRVVQLALKYHF